MVSGNKYAKTHSPLTTHHSPLTMLLSLLGLRTLNPVSLKGKRVWIIGASSGLGAALAQQCAADGAILALSSRRQSELEKVHASLAGEDHLVIPLDVTDMKSFQNAFERLKAEWNLESRIMNHEGGQQADDNSSNPQSTSAGARVSHEPAKQRSMRGSEDPQREQSKIDFTIYSSGLRPVPEWETFKAAEQLQGLDVNLGGIFRLLELMIPQWEQQNGGNLTIIGSLIATGAMPLAGSYGASKAGVAYLAENLRMDLAEKNVQVQLASPGFIDTPMVAWRPRKQMPCLMQPHIAAWKIRKLLGQEDVFEIHFPKMLSIPTRLLRWLLPRDTWMRLLVWANNRTSKPS